jgi:hypothetical protein
MGQTGQEIVAESDDYPNGGRSSSCQTSDMAL